MTSRWTYLQRTVEGIADYFSPLQSVIRNNLLPKLRGRHFSELNRRIIALPLRFRGLSIRNPELTPDREYKNSVQVTKQLTDIILRQDTSIALFDHEEIKEKKNYINKIKEEVFRLVFGLYHE